MLPISFLSDYGHARRVGGRLPRRDRADRPRRDRDRHRARSAAGRRPARRIRAARTRCRSFPPESCMAVVDPGVGSERRAVALAVPRRDAAGRPRQRPAVARGAGSRRSRRRRSTSRATPFRLDPVSATFHGRDLFAPVAAHLALGAAPEDAGRPDRSPRRWCVSRRRRPRSDGATVRTRGAPRRPVRQRAAAGPRAGHGDGRPPARERV